MAGPSASLRISGELRGHTTEPNLSMLESQDTNLGSRQSKIPNYPSYQSWPSRSLSGSCRAAAGITARAHSRPQTMSPAMTARHIFTTAPQKAFSLTPLPPAISPNFPNTRDSQSTCVLSPHSMTHSDLAATGAAGRVATQRAKVQKAWCACTKPFSKMVNRAASAAPTSELGASPIVSAAITMNVTANMTQQPLRKQAMKCRALPPQAPDIAAAILRLDSMKTHAGLHTRRARFPTPQSAGIKLGHNSPSSATSNQHHAHRMQPPLHHRKIPRESNPT